MIGTIDRDETVVEMRGVRGRDQREAAPCQRETMGRCMGGMGMSRESEKAWALSVGGRSRCRSRLQGRRTDGQTDRVVGPG
jgi:hypothetical protein